MGGVQFAHHVFGGTTHSTQHLMYPSNKHVRTHQLPLSPPFHHVTMHTQHTERKTSYWPGYRNVMGILHLTLTLENVSCLYRPIPVQRISVVTFECLNLH